MEERTDKKVPDGREDTSKAPDPAPAGGDDDVTKDEKDAEIPVQQLPMDGVCGGY